VADVRHILTFWDAGLHPDEGSSSLKYCACAQSVHRACAQNVSDVIHSSAFWDAGLHPDQGSSAHKYRAWHRMCQMLSMVSHFWMLAYTQMRVQVLSSTAPAHRMCEMLLIVSLLGMLAYTQMRGQMRSSSAPAHRTFQMLFIGWDASLHRDEGSSALKCRACTQKVTDVALSFHMSGCWPTPRWGSSALKYRACAQNVSDVTHSLHILGCRPVHPDPTRPQSAYQPRTIRVLRGSKTAPRPLGVLVTLPVKPLRPWFYTFSVPG
jgi:hypothetical protein